MFKYCPPNTQPSTNQPSFDISREQKNLQHPVLTISCMGGPYRPPLSDNSDLIGTELLLDLRPVCKFQFVRCGPVEKNTTLYLSRFNSGGLTKFKNTFFQIAKLKFLMNFADFRQNSRIFKNSQGSSLRAMGLIFWILALHISI